MIDYAPVRFPRARIVLAGVDAIPLSFEVEANSFSDADTAQVDLAVSALPAALSIDKLQAQTSLTIEVFAGLVADPDNYDDKALDSIFYGHVDRLQLSLTERAVTLECRDLTGQMIDTKTDLKYQNMTASAIAAQIAAKYGLTPVITATTRKAGTYTQIDHARLQTQRTEWDLLTWLAHEEDFLCFVNGRELRFQPRPDESQTPYEVTYTPPAPDGGYAQGDFTRMMLTRSYTLAKGIKVTVRSWNARTASSTIKSASRGSNPTEYVYSIPGLSPKQCQARADAILSDLSKHEMVLSFDGPAKNDLKLTDIVKLSGTPFDGLFYPARISRRMDAHEGYRWSVEARNKARDQNEGSQAA